MSIKAYVRLLRPRQWLKNLILFFPPFLGGDVANMFPYWWLLPLVSFCLVSSAIYVFNDFRDIDSDRKHPIKSKRPLAAGEVAPQNALAIAVLCLVVGLATGWKVNSSFLIWEFLYLGVSASYTLWLKSVPLADLFCISAGFVFRISAGGDAFDVPISPWLFLCVFLLSLYLALGKRLCEKLHLGASAKDHRSVLALYPDGFLDGALVMVGGAVLVVYTLYVVARPGLIWSVPVCCFGLLRYLLRVKQGKGGDPTESLLNDRPLLVTSILWSAMVGWAIYGGF